ncbi:MAG: hypothetical protein P4L87_21070 [Formivibrio sp.]|nr:hypothetical protein [Formivibrio sp.]
MRTRTDEITVWDANADQRAFMVGVVYFMIVFLCLVLAFVNIIYGLSFTPSQSANWMSSIAISVISGALPVLEGNAPCGVGVFLLCLQVLSWLSHRLPV